MRDTFGKSLQKLISDKDRYVKMTALLLVLSILVSLNVFWMLRQKGITMAGDAACGKQEHTHDDACYEIRLICAAQKDEHSHTQACYAPTEPAQAELICQNADAAHIHDTACYAQSEQSAGGELICGQSVTEHIHNEKCYEKALICGIEVHTHSLECYSDASADVETQLDWQNMLAGYRSGIVAENIIRIARSQIGYKESERNFILNDDGTRSGYTRYGAWYGMPYGAWSAMFVCFCLNYAGADQSLLPFNTGANAMAALWQANGSFAAAKEYSPLPGDIAFFNNNTAGVITAVSNNMLEVVRGDIYNAVCVENIDALAGSLSGYGIITRQAAQNAASSAPSASPAADAEQTAEPTPTPTADEQQQASIACNCGAAEGASVNEHGEACAYKLNLVNIALQQSAEDIYAAWQSYNECERAFLLEYMAAAAELTAKADAVNTLIAADNMLSELSVQLGDAYFTASGSFAQGSILNVAPIEYSLDELNALLAPAAASRCAAWGISIELDANAQAEPAQQTAAQQPAEGISISVTAPDIYAADTETLYIAYVDEAGNLATNEQVILINGSITFTFGGSGNYILYAITAYEGEIIEGETVAGRNWISLENRGFFTYWEQFLGEAAAAEPVRAKLRGARAVAAAPSYKDDADPSDVQISAPGGQNSDDYVTVSKTINGTELENVFDITLTVNTMQDIQQVVNEPDMAVVIVMDISNTMNENFSGETRYAAAMTAAENFLDKFAAENNGTTSKIGYVAFNTNAYEIFGLSTCSTPAQAAALKNKMRQQTGSIIKYTDANGNYISEAKQKERFTNIEAGLQMGADMLAGVNNKNKFIIFLSDGFPTTYISSGYKGYDPYTPSGTLDKDGVFYNSVITPLYKSQNNSNKTIYCDYGTSYSNTAAIRARNKAASIKSSGVKIFSIGIDVGGQTILGYTKQDYNSTYRSDNYPAWRYFSVIECKSNQGVSMSYINDPENSGKKMPIYKGLEIGEGGSDYKEWLKNSIGSGYYYDSTKAAELNAAYDEIFSEIKKTVGESTKADWVASDPVPILSQHVEFIGFFNKNSELVSGNLKGESKENAENTANAAAGTESTDITWDLKESGFVSSSSGSITTYSYSLTYRVRLKNEADEREAFVDHNENNAQVYETNGETKLTYRVIETVNGTQSVSDAKQIEFPIPSVYGYLGKFNFQKVNGQTGAPLEGVTFKLMHDTQNCSICRGNETSVSINDFEATSDASGNVSFTRVPSGHTYILKETGYLPGYNNDTNSYSVIIDYDKLTVTVKDKDGNAIAWDNKIANMPTQYSLPTTGGVGITPFVITGSLLITAAVISGYIRRKRRSKA